MLFSKILKVDDEILQNVILVTDVQPFKLKITKLCTIKINSTVYKLKLNTLSRYIFTLWTFLSSLLK